MKKLAVIINQNQNEISAKEAEKIRRTLKKEFPDYRLKVLKNTTADQDENFLTRNPEYVYTTFNTKDVNNEVWAEWVDGLVPSHENQIIALN